MNDLIDRLEKNIRKAIDATPGIMDVSERDYCDAVLDAIGTIRFGLNMRLEELEAEC
ncbi:hypothetical protein SH661x_001789 [Planctomicrobium sp. SH661]|uniref:hypothetical protein n=1 Tax=Planctomicrobium sp. SH661 TaxID=3448124 RepID=UPI003F5AF787